jgi:hypothetical protein
MRLSSGNVLTIILIFTLVATMVVELAASSPATLTETVIKVEPTLIEFGNPAGDPIPIPGTQFTVTIRIYNVTNLYGCDLKFTWNTTFLQYVNHSVYVPRDTYVDGVLWNPVIPVADQVNTTEGTYEIAYASLAPAPSFNGTGTIFTMTFEVIKQPYDYETGGPNVEPIDTVLDFSSTDLAPRSLETPVEPITHGVEPATVRIWEKRSELPAYPILKVMPTKVENLPRNSIFNMDIWIVGVDPTYDIQSFNITLDFNSTLIEATGIAEGPWLKSYAENTTETTKQMNNDKGIATYALEQVPPTTHPPPTTSGVLFTITFQVTYESLEYPPPSCELTLGPTEILDRSIGPLVHTTENSTYTAYRPLPIAKFTWSPSGNILPRGQTITFNASESYYTLGIKLYAWDFGDGNKTTVTTSIVTHVYEAAGTVTVVLNVTDYGNSWNTANATLSIIEPQNAPQISVINPLTEDDNFTFYRNTTSVGFRFNVTVWVSNVTSLYAYQVRLDYNSTLLKATRAWLPTWDPEWVFYGKTTSKLPPSFGINYVQIGDAIIETYQTLSGAGILSVIELEIIYAPTTGKGFCNLDISNTNTFLLDPNINEIPSDKTSGHFTYVGPEKVSSTVSIMVSHSAIDFGENTTISGAISPPRTANVTLLYRLQGETLWKNLTMTPTDPEGKYAYTWTPPKAGVHELNATWAGDPNALPANETGTLTVNKIIPTITIDVQPAHVTAGSNVTLNGTISPTIIGANITMNIQYRLQGDANWTELTIVQTDSQGQYTYLWKPDKVGTCELKASWPGDQNTRQAESETKTVKVEAQPTETVPYIVAGLATIAIILAAAIYFARIRKPKK